MATHTHNIITKRLVLRPLDKEDTAFIFSLLNTESWLQFIGNRNIHSHTDAKNYIEKILNSENIHYWKVETREHQTPIGVVTFLKRDYLEHFDIGFAFLPEFEKQGFAYESSKAVLDFAKSELQQKTIAATTIPANVNSINLLKKLGFSFSKELESNNEKLLVYINKESRLNS